MHDNFRYFGIEIVLYFVQRAPVKAAFEKIISMDNFWTYYIFKAMWFEECRRNIF
jgi:hypothetical protein